MAIYSSIDEPRYFVERKCILAVSTNKSHCNFQFIAVAGHEGEGAKNAGFPIPPGTGSKRPAPLLTLLIISEYIFTLRYIYLFFSCFCLACLLQARLAQHPRKEECPPKVLLYVVVVVLDSHEHLGLNTHLSYLKQAMQVTFPLSVSREARILLPSSKRESASKQRKPVKRRRAAGESPKPICAINT